MQTTKKFKLEKKIPAFKSYSKVILINNTFAGIVKTNLSKIVSNISYL